RLHLRRLPSEGAAVLVGPGENAGVIDAGDGIAVAVRIESHNHPSAIEPYQGAATGVGGILRDVFTMGARPIAVMDSLRFGPLDGSESLRPSVQVGDPFEEKRLLEACLELLDAGLVVGIQDLGGAGLTCACSETAARGRVGMDVDVTAVRAASRRWSPSR